jgi:hypothetical protein
MLLGRVSAVKQFGGIITGHFDNQKVVPAKASMNLKSLQ